MKGVLLMMEKNELSLIRKIDKFDNPLFRHIVKKNNLNSMDSAVLAVLIDLTDNAKHNLKTTYKAIADTAGVSATDSYHSIATLHRLRIINYKADENYVLFSFNEITEEIDEISLTYKNAREIKNIKKDILNIREQNYIPKNDLFDLLYPLVGKVVLKKITEAFSELVNYINKKLETTFNFNMLVKRIKSRATGIPLSEIILSDLLPYYVDEIFVLDKKSSLLIAHCSKTEQESIDKDIIGSMLVAINDFITTSFKHAKEEIVDQI